MGDTDAVVGWIRKICSALPDTAEKPFGGHTAPSFRVREKLFVMITEDRRNMSVKAGPGVQQALVAAAPDRFFVPKYVGPKGWVGARLDVAQDPDELAELIEDSYRMVAPRRLVAMLDRKEAGRGSETGPRRGE